MLSNLCQILLTPLLSPRVSDEWYKACGRVNHYIPHKCSWSILFMKVRETLRLSIIHTTERSHRSPMSPSAVTKNSKLEILNSAAIIIFTVVHDLGWEFKCKNILKSKAIVPTAAITQSLVFGHTLQSIDTVMQNTKAAPGYGWLGEP